MPPKPRQITTNQRSALSNMQDLEKRSDAELAADTRNRAAAQAILGARASERYDAVRAREHFRAAIAAARPQERLQLRRMAEASLALAERRPADLKAAAERLGQTPPSDRQLLMLRLMGYVAPAPGSSTWQKVRAGLIVVGIIVLLIALGWAVVQLVSLPFGGIGADVSIFWGFLLVVAVIAVLVVLGRRRQGRAKVKAAEARAAAAGPSSRRDRR